MALAWHRTTNFSIAWDSGGFWLSAIPNGQTYRRVRFSWGFVGNTPSVTRVFGLEGFGFVLGLVTTFGDGTETPPNALTAPEDAAPPTRRWIWWEGRSPVISAIDNSAGIIAWRDSGPQEPCDAKAQVLATGVPAGQTLNLWASWASQFPWDPDGDVSVWVTASVLAG